MGVITITPTIWAVAVKPTSPTHFTETQEPHLPSFSVPAIPSRTFSTYIAPEVAFSPNRRLILALTLWTIHSHSVVWEVGWVSDTRLPAHLSDRILLMLDLEKKNLKILL